MSRGKYLSLEEARKKGQIDRFCKEHPATGDEEFFDELLGKIAKGKPASARLRRSQDSYCVMRRCSLCWIMRRS
jgi:hypothetical protein